MSLIADVTKNECIDSEIGRYTYSMIGLKPVKMKLINECIFFLLDIEKERNCNFDNEITVTCSSQCPNCTV